MPSPVLARGLPPASIILGSLLAHWAVIASAPVVPPLGFLVYLGWRQLRPGLLPVWAGLPLGLIDDLFSGQPFGTGVLLWSAAAIAFEIIDARFPWRSYAFEWLVASGLILTYMLIGLLLANVTGGSTALKMIVPQILLSLLFYPVVGRTVALCDRLRLLPFREIH